VFFKLALDRDHDVIQVHRRLQTRAVINVNSLDRSQCRQPLPVSEHAVARRLEVQRIFGSLHVPTQLLGVGA